MSIKDLIFKVCNDITINEIATTISILNQIMDLLKMLMEVTLNIYVIKSMFLINPEEFHVSRLI